MPSFPSLFQLFDRFLDYDIRLSRRLTFSKSGRLWPIASFMAHLGDGPPVYAILGGLLVWAWIANRVEVLVSLGFILISLFLAATLVTLIKYTIRRARPNDPGGFVSLKQDQYSFPSGHAARMSALAVSTWYFSSALGLLLLGLACLVAAARIMVGIHYLSDVMVGLLLGGGGTILIIVWIVWLLQGTWLAYL